MRRRPAAALLALLPAACAATGDPDPWPNAAVSSEQTVGWLDEQPVGYGEVARYLRTKDPEAFARSLEGLVLERVTLAEAEPLGIDVPRAKVTRETEQRMQQLQAGVRRASKEQTGEEIDPALWLQRVSGSSMAQVRQWVRRHTEVELLQDRLLRYEMLTSRRVEVSILVVGDEALAKKLAARLRRGDAPAPLAKKHSVHATAAAGGRFPFPLLQADLNEEAIRRPLFAAKKGDVVGPLPAKGGDEAFFQIYRIEAVGAAREVSYRELRRDVERSLEARPVHVAEYERWRRRILLRHGFVAARPPGRPG